MNYRTKTLEKNRKSFKGTKPKYRNKLNIESKPFFPRENNNERIISDIDIKEDTKNLKLNLNAKEYKPSETILRNQRKEREKEKKKYTYTYEYLKHFENMEKSKETNLLTKDVLDHINQIEDGLKTKKMENLLESNILSHSNDSNCNTSKSSCSSLSNKLSLEIWARPDYTKEKEEAENNKRNFEECDKKDIITKELRELLNKMTKDNYEEIKIKILEIIKNEVENQNKLLDIIFLKSCQEESFVGIYAQLCKYLNKELPQKIQKKTKKENKKYKKSTIFREKLLEKCKEMIKFEEKKIFEEFNKENIDEEREKKIKNIIIGNALFISELINLKMLSKKASCECIDYLFKKYNEGNNKKIKLINIEVIIKLIDKLGTLLENENNKKDKHIFQQKLEETFKKLEEIKKDENIPERIKYLILNIIKKKENKFKLSEYEKSKIAKSKKELEEGDKEKEDLTQEDINNLIKKDLEEYKQIIEIEGDSKKYSWNITTDIYDGKYKGFESILEGYFMSCVEFIEKEGNLKYAKNYIKELLEYYHTHMEDNEKNILLSEIIELFELINYFSLDGKDILCVYEHVLEICIKNEIFNIKDLDHLIETKYNKEEDFKKDIKNLSIIFQNIYKNIANEKLKKQFRENNFINKLINGLIL